MFGDRHCDGQVISPMTRVLRPVCRQKSIILLEMDWHFSANRALL